MFGLSASHLLILMVVLLLFGAKRLPELGASLGSGMRAFKASLEGLENDEPKRRPQEPSLLLMAEKVAADPNQKNEKT